jgi:hypothetical protein
LFSVVNRRCCIGQQITNKCNSAESGDSRCMNAPAPVPHPPFNRWLFERRLTNTWAASNLGCSTEYVRLMCLPLSDPKRRRPGVQMRRRIAELTGGAIGADAWGLTCAVVLDE